MACCLFKIKLYWKTATFIHYIWSIAPVALQQERVEELPIECMAQEAENIDDLAL